MLVTPVLMPLDATALVTSLLPYHPHSRSADSGLFSTHVPTQTRVAHRLGHLAAPGSWLLDVAVVLARRLLAGGPPAAIARSASSSLFDCALLRVSAHPLVLQWVFSLHPLELPLQHPRVSMLVWLVPPSMFEEIWWLPPLSRDHFGHPTRRDLAAQAQHHQCARAQHPPESASPRSPSFLVGLLRW